MDHDVQRAMEPYWNTLFHNPSSVSLEAVKVREAVLESRKAVARALRCKPFEVVFTSGGTESNNLAIHGVARARKKPGHMVISAIEHASVLEPVMALKKQGWKVSVVPVDADGRVPLDELKKFVTKKTVLVSVMLASNEVGTIQPVQEIVETVKAVSKKILVHTDACQATGALSLNTQRLGVDLLTINGSKCYGPKGVGALFVRTGLKLAPLLFGGQQEKALRAGTENVPAVVGLGEAVTKAERMRGEESKRLERIRNAIMRKALETIPGTTLNGPERGRLPNNIHFSFDGAQGENLVIYLEKNGVTAATGAACTTASTKPSHVLKAMRVPANRAATSVRLTLGRSTTKNDVGTIVAALKKSVNSIRKLQAQV